MKKSRKETNVKIKEITSKASKPEFKPGNKPYCEYDGAVLNADVPWNEVVNELITSGLTANDIANYAECPLETISKVIDNDFDQLSFRSGARLITLHSTTFPSSYNF